MRMTTVSSGRTTTQALTSGEPSAARTMVGPPKGISRPIARPVPIAAVPMTKARRGRGGAWAGLGGWWEGAAGEDVGDGLVVVFVGRLRLLLEKRSHRHDHSALTISALRNVVVDPGLLDFMQRAVGSQTFDRGDLFAAGFADQHPTRAHRNAVNMERAGPALCYAATVFGAGQAGIFPDRPKQRRIRLDIHVESFAIDDEVHRRSP